MSFADLEKCLEANISSENRNIRSNAEKHLQSIKNKQPMQYLMGLLQIISKSSNNSVRAFAAILLRQSLGILDDTYNRMPSNTRKEIQSMLVNQIKNELNQNVLVQICDALAALACKLLPQNQWPSLIPDLLEFTKKNDNRLKIAFLIVLDKLAICATDVLRANMQNIRNVLIHALEDNNINIRIYGLTAMVSLLCSMADENELNYFSDILPLLFKSIHPNTGDLVIQKTCESLQILADNQTTFFENALKPITCCLTDVINSNNLDMDTKRLAFNLLLTILQHNFNKIDPNLVASQVIPLVFVFLNNFNENLDWNSPTDDSEQINFEFGAECLVNIISIVGPELFLNFSQKIFDVGFNDNNNNWKQRLIALKMVEKTLDQCSYYYEKQLNNIINATGKSLSHSNNYIRYNALLVIKQLSVVFGINDSFIDQYHEPIMNALINMLNNAQNEHRCVLMQICDTLAHFIFCDEEDVMAHKYASSMLKGFYNLLNYYSNDAEIQSFAFKAVSVIASVINIKFVEYYNTFMKFSQQLLTDILVHKKHNDSNGTLRGRAMECIGQICIAVPFEKCRNDAHSAIKFLIPFIESEKKKGSESYNFMMTLFANLSQCLKYEFEPYLNQIIPFLISSAKIKSVSVKNSIELNNNNNNNNNSDHKSDDVITQSVAGIRFEVNTAEMNEKCSAINHFAQYVQNLEHLYLPYVKSTAEVLIPIIRQPVKLASNKMRLTAIETMGPLLRCLKMGLLKKNQMNENQIKQCMQAMLKDIFIALIDAMNAVDDVEEVTLICVTIQELLEYVDPQTFPAEIVSDITEQIQNAIEEKRLRLEQSGETPNNESINDNMNDNMSNNNDDIVEDDIDSHTEEVEAELADVICDVITKLVKTFGGKYIEIFDKLLGNTCTELIDVQKSIETEQVMGISMLTELIKYGGNAANKYISPVTKISHYYLSQNNISPLLKQSAGYAIGVCAQRRCLNEPLKWLQLLTNVINQNDSKNDDNIVATENCISAVGKLLKYYCDQLKNNNHMILSWIQMLPIVKDLDEREFCNEYLLEILQSNLDNIFQSHSSIPQKLIHIMAVAIVNEDKAKNQFKQLFSHLMNKFNQNMIQNCVQNLPQNLANAFL